MTIDQIIALSASVGAFLSAFATFLTVRQMTQQREASYQPELVLSRTLLEASKSPIAEGSLPTHWVHKPSSEGEADVLPMFFSLPLRNVGLGTAKSISATWSFPIEEMVKQVNELAQRTLTPAYFSLKNGELSIKSESLGGGTSFWGNQKQENLDYVLPAAIQKESVPLRLPPAFIMLASALLFLSEKDKERKLSQEIPQLMVRLGYRDIGNKRHSAVFEISLELSAISGNGEYFMGYLESRKCN